MSDGVIRHAIRMTVKFSQRAYVLPATHYASYATEATLPPMGARARLKASFNCFNLAFEARVVCTALKTYGAIVADNGADWFLSGEVGFKNEKIESFSPMRGGTSRLSLTFQKFQPLRWSS